MSRSARLNFGIPDSEYIVEVDGSGAATSCYNQDTQTEYVGGGGGGSDYSVARLSVNNSGASNTYVIFAAFNDNDNEDDYSTYCSYVTGPWNFNFDVILYKGKAEYMLDIDSGSNVPTYQLSGDIEAIAPDGSTGMITGNATIVITDA